MRAILVAGYAAILLPGCATIVGGAGDKEVTIATEPPGAQVYVDGQPRGATPAAVRLSRRTDHEITVHEPGYEPVNLKVKQSFNPWVFGNILVGGLIGIVVDVCTGATFTLEPDEIKLTLRPVELIPSSAVAPQAPAKAPGSNANR